MSNQNKRFGLLKILPPDELGEIFNLPADDKNKLIISVYADYISKHFILFRGDGTSLIAPFEMFRPSKVNTPNFEDYEVVDFGNALRLGSYVASTRSILYDLDPEYRKYCDSIKNKNLNIN